jgi:hypothetical protein
MDNNLIFLGITVLLVFFLVAFIVFKNTKNDEFDKKIKEAEKLKKTEKEKKEKIDKEKLQEKIERQKDEVNQIPHKIYPDFDFDYCLKELDMSIEDVKEFLGEFIEQIENQKIEIEDNIKVLNIENLKNLTHRIKGSSSSLRIQGLGNCISDFYTYVRKNHEDIEISEINKFMEDFNYYFDKLKKNENIN